MLYLPTPEDVVKLTGPETPDGAFHVGLDKKLKWLAPQGLLRCIIDGSDEDEIVVLWFERDDEQGIQLRESNTTSYDGRSHDAFHYRVPSLVFEHDRNEGTVEAIVPDTDLTEHGIRIIRRGAPYIIGGLMLNLPGDDQGLG